MENRQCKCGNIIPTNRTIKKLNGEEICDNCWCKIPDKEIGTGVQMHTFTPHTFDDICETPIHVTSKRQLKELCKVHNVRAARLM